MTAPSPKSAEAKISGRCPICTKPTVKEHRPFCGKRCAQIDLGRWLNGSYAVPGKPTGNIDDGRFDEED